MPDPAPRIVIALEPSLKPVLAFLVGFLMLTILYMIPFLGLIMYGITSLWGLGAAIDTVRWVSGFPMPEFSRDYEYVAMRHPDRYAVYALSAHSRVDELAAQCRQFQPKVAVVGSADAADQLAALLRAMHLDTQVAWGEQALCDIASAGDVEDHVKAVLRTDAGAAVGGMGDACTALRARLKIARCSRSSSPSM